MLTTAFWQLMDEVFRLLIRIEEEAASCLKTTQE